MKTFSIIFRLFKNRGHLVPQLILLLILCITTSMVAQDSSRAAVVIYYGENYSGGSKELTVGSYQGIRDFDNDLIKSIKVKNGYKVTLFQNGLNVDPKLLLTADKPSLGNFNDQISNILVEAVPTVAVTEKTITLQSAANNEFLCATDGLRNNEWLYCKKGTPVTFVVEGPLNNCALRVKGEGLYFSEKGGTGAVKLLSTAEGANFSLEKQANGTYAIKSLKYNQYVWLSGESPYITKSGNPDNASGQWIISGLESNTLKAGESLVKEQRLTSANGAYYLRIQQDDGNLCIYKTADNGFVWGSMVNGFSGATMIMQTDGNLVVYDASNVDKWSSKTHPFFDSKFNDTANSPVKVVLEDTGALVLYNAAGSAMWSSK